MSKPSILTALGIVIDRRECHALDFVQSFAFENTQELYAAGILPVTATMHVNERNMHPFGKLSGGASIAMAECLAGYGSRLFCSDGEFPVGQQVSASHISGADEGDNLLASASLVHRGKKTHIWNVDIHNEKGRLVCTVRVTNMVIERKVS